MNAATPIRSYILPLFCLMLLVLVGRPGWGQGIALPGQVGSTSGRLQADHVRYAAGTQTFTADGHVRLVLGDVQIRADRARLERRTGVAVASGRVVVTQRDTALRAPQVRYEIGPRVAEASGGAVLTQQAGMIRSATLRFDLRAQVTVATGDVRVTNGEMRLGASILRHAAATGDVTADGPITLVRQGSTLTGRMLVGNLRSQSGEVHGDARLVRPTGPAPASGGPPAGDTAAQETVITAGWMRFSWGTGDAEAGSSVRVTQKARSASGDAARYTEVDRRIVVTGHVSMRDEDGNTLRADKVIISLLEETFEAVGNVETVFQVKRGK